MFHGSAGTSAMSWPARVQEAADALRRGAGTREPAREVVAPERPRLARQPHVAGGNAGGRPRRIAEVRARRGAHGRHRAPRTRAVSSTRRIATRGRCGSRCASRRQRTVGRSDAWVPSRAANALSSAASDRPADVACGYTSGMKTAISIPDDVFAEAERLARRLKTSRSELYSRALREFVARHGSEHVTETLDRLYAEAPPEKTFAISAARRTLRRSPW